MKEVPSMQIFLLVLPLQASALASKSPDVVEDLFQRHVSKQTTGPNPSAGPDALARSTARRTRGPSNSPSELKSSSPRKRHGSQSSRKNSGSPPPRKKSGSASQTKNSGSPQDPRSSSLARQESVSSRSSDSSGVDYPSDANWDTEEGYESPSSKAWRALFGNDIPPLSEGEMSPKKEQRPESTPQGPENSDSKPRNALKKKKTLTSVASGLFSLCGAGNGNRSPKESPSRPTAPGQPSVGPAKTFKFSKTLRNSRFSRTITESLFFKRIYSTRSDSLTIGTEKEGKKYPLPVLFPGPIGSEQLNAGDVIVCRQQHFLRSRRTHWFFAINRYEVLHVQRPENFHGVANIRGDRWVRLPDRFKYIDFQHCKNLGNRARLIFSSNKRAKADDSEAISSRHNENYVISGDCDDEADDNGSGGGCCGGGIGDGNDGIGDGNDGIGDSFVCTDSAADRPQEAQCPEVVPSLSISEGGDVAAVMSAPAPGRIADSSSASFTQCERPSDDPFFWKVNEETVNFFLKNDFNQNIDGDFLKSARTYTDGDRVRKRYCNLEFFKRKLQNGISISRANLVYSPSQGSIYCAPCMLFNRGATKFSSETGFSDWAHARDRIADHENSSSHRDCLIKFRDCKNEIGRIDHELRVQITKEQEYWKNVLRRVVSVIKKLASRGLAFRGTDETFGSVSNGNFMMCLELISEYDPFLADHIARHGSTGRGNVSYLSSTIYEELIELMGKSVLEHVVKLVKIAKYYAVIVDSTRDLNKKDQLTLLVRYVNTTGIPEERFLTFIENCGHTGEEMAESVLKYLAFVDLSIEDCRGQSYDNAANMSGKFKGLQARLKAANSVITYVPCALHSMNLSGSSAAESCKMTVVYFDFLQSVYNFISSSTHRWLFFYLFAKRRKTVAH
ncbi:uncharacterized protein [Bemisia tabaci]|uniref:uncharacterized protein n=1 Tax=Bemisia tabaci TaxID=7038 RepID=UPI003B28D27D